MDVSESRAPVCAVIKRRLYRQIEDVDWCPCLRRVCVGENGRAAGASQRVGVSGGERT